MCAMLFRLPPEHEACRHVYLDEPGDLADEVSRSNLVSAPDSNGTGFCLSNIEKPEPFQAKIHHGGYSFGINLGPSFRMDLRLSGLRSVASIGTGSVLALPGGGEMRMAYSGLENYRALIFSCSASYLERVAVSAGLHFPSQGLSPAWNPQADVQTLSLAQSIIAELQSERCTPMLLEALTLALSMQVLRRTAGATLTSSRTAAGLAPHILRRVTDYMQAHLQETISLDTLATVAGLSTYHFCRMFKQSTGMPPHRYLAQLRIDRAGQLLLQTGTPIGDIAFDMGFSSSSQFSHFFRKQVGCTPQEYRRQGTGMALFELPRQTTFPE